MMKKNYFSVIIPARNEENYIEECLESLMVQNYSGPFEVIVVDNGSSDRTAEIAHTYGVKVLTEPQKGVSRALIDGCNEAQGDILAFTDADTRVPENWLTIYNKKFNSDPEIVATGGMFLFYEDRFLARVLFNKILKPILLLYVEKWIEPRYPTLSCANMAVRKILYEKVGGFDPEIGWGQEIDLVRKLKKYGKVTFDRNIIVRTSFRRFSGEKKNGVYVFLDLSRS